MKIKLFGGLREFVGGMADVEMAINEPISVRQIIEALNIPDRYVYVVEKEGRMVEKDAIIQEDEGEIKFLPVIAGG